MDKDERDRLREEEWRAIPGYSSYKVNASGTIVRRTVASVGTSVGRTLSFRKSRAGYFSVGLTINGKTKMVKVHRIVATAFIQNNENKPQVNHKNGIKTDNRVENLEWCTNQENARHASDHGLIAHGARNGRARLDDQTVRAIHARSSLGESNCAIARSLGMSPEAIRRIVLRTNWKHVV